MLQKANVLLLDEPTNHLDLDSKEMLEQALVDYPGTILFVSHDRYFINRIATKLFELSGDGLVEYLGDYDYYVAKKEEMREWARLDSHPPASPDSGETAKSTYEQEKEEKRRQRQRQRRLEEIEAEIAALEAQIAETEQQLCDPSVYGDYETVQQLTQENEKRKQQLETLLAEWEQLYASF